METALPTAVNVALKEWAVVVRALGEGRQVILLRKGGIREASGEFEVEAREAVLLPTYLHEGEQRNAIQPCYRQWLHEENNCEPRDEVARLTVVAQITDIVTVQRVEPLITLMSQHIFSEEFLRFRFENEPHKPLYCLFVRAWNLPEPVTMPMEPNYYGCKSWVTLNQPIDTHGATPAMSAPTYQERVRVTKRILAE